VQLFAAAIELPVMLVAGILIGGGAGWWLDHGLGTAPWLMLFLGILGFGAGLREIVRKLSQGNS
jgi:ATP synthase protein I